MCTEKPRKPDPGYLKDTTLQPIKNPEFENKAMKSA